MFLPRLNKISGGCEKILPVSLSFWSNLKFLKNVFDCEVVRVTSERKWNFLVLFLQC